MRYCSTVAASVEVDAEDSLDVPRRGLTLAAAGTLIGLLGAMPTNHLLAGMLCGISLTDVSTMSLVMILLLRNTLASVIPARSSRSIDPIVALGAD